jgi:pimeloyl-ACP methyl ester carboxylesterase
MLKNPTTRRAYADGPFGQIHFQYGREGGFPLVLLHQAPMMSGQFDNVYEPLAKRGLRPIGIDMPGFGMSDPAPAPLAIPELAKCVEPVLDHLEIQHAAILGHHTGALAATEAAIALPDRLTAIVLNGPLPLDNSEREGYLERRRNGPKSGPDRANAQQFVDVFKLREQLAKGSVPIERLYEYVTQTFMGCGEYWIGHHAAYRYRHEATIQAISQPGMILTNTGDVIYPHAQRARELRPDFAYFELAGGGVDIVDQQPEAWADAVTTFLANHDPRQSTQE